jgi:hypothetical protein
MPKIWNLLKHNGILFINETPHRYFPIVQHTTGGLPGINYLPDGLALIYAHNYGKRRARLKNDNWETLLKKGIRGGTVREVMRILGASPHRPVLMNPNRLGAKDRVDLYVMSLPNQKSSLNKKRTKIKVTLAKSLYNLTGIIFLPTLDLAIRKS